MTRRLCVAMFHIRKNVRRERCAVSRRGSGSSLLPHVWIFGDPSKSPANQGAYTKRDGKPAASKMGSTLLRSRVRARVLPLQHSRIWWKARSALKLSPKAENNARESPALSLFLSPSKTRFVTCFSKFFRPVHSILTFRGLAHDPPDGPPDSSYGAWRSSTSIT
jgi:hypothetical protein